VGIFEEIIKHITMNHKKIAIAFCLGLAGMTGTAQAMQSLAHTTHVSREEMKAVGAKHTRQSKTIEESIGGIPRVTFMPDYGMSPKEYGMKYGHGNKKGRSNRLRFSHNAKLKRR
jgi:hypothetical protein